MTPTEARLDLDACVPELEGFVAALTEAGPESVDELAADIGRLLEMLGAAPAVTTETEPRAWQGHRAEAGLAVAGPGLLLTAALSTTRSPLQINVAGATSLWTLEYEPDARRAGDADARPVLPVRVSGVTADGLFVAKELAPPGSVTDTVEPQELSPDAVAAAAGSVADADAASGRDAPKRWFFRHGERQFGPLLEAEIRQLLRVGNLGPDTMVRRIDSDEWQQASAVEALSAAVPGGAQESPEPPTRRMGDAAIVFLNGPLEGQRLHLDLRARIGRGEHNDICVPDPTVSACHAELEVTEEGCFVSDLGSTNKTAVSDTPIEGRTRLRDGDTVRIGKVLFRVLLSDEAPVERTTMLPRAALKGSGLSCRGCGRRVGSDARFCSACGERQPVRPLPNGGADSRLSCPRCKATVSAGARYCSSCGASLPESRYCRRCGQGFASGDRFCSFCGRSVG
jgi:hypothetical protein